MTFVSDRRTDDEIPAEDEVIGWIDEFSNRGRWGAPEETRGARWDRRAPRVSVSRFG